MLKKLSIRDKLLLIILGSTIISATIGLGIIGYKNIQQYRTELESEAKINTRLTSRYVLSPMLFDDMIEVERILSELQSVPHIDFAQVYNREDELVAVYNPGNIAFTPDSIPHESVSDLNNNYLHVFEPILFEGKHFGTIYTMASTQPVKTKARAFLLVVLLVMLLIVLLAFVLGSILQRYISGPINKLVTATDKISHAEDLTLRVEKTTYDETGQLVDSFNNMLNQLEKESSERDQALKELKREQYKLENISQSAFDAIILVSNAHKIESWNKAATRIFGFYADDIIGQSFFSLFVSEKDIRQHIKYTIEHGYPKSHEIELPAIRKDQQTFPVEVSLAITTLEKEKHYVATIRDITRRKQIEQELINAKEKAEESDRLKSAFLANMSHEIRTPLNAIIGFSELLGSPKLFESKRKDYLRYIGNSGTSLLNLINDIIDISKIEAGQMKIKKHDFDLHSTLNELWESFRNTSGIKDSKARNLHLEIPSPKSEKFIYSDPYRLKQILTNLLSNAVKFTEEGFIKFGYSQKGDKLLFFVEDTGIGIPKDKQELIFDRFGQAHDTFTKNQGGTGLGLSISKKLAEILGGQMWLESEEGEGATFYFTLPDEQSKSTHKQADLSKTHLNMNYEWNNKTILIAEDEEINYLFLQEALKATKATIIWAKDGEEAINICLENNDIDLVLMDVKMPVVDGYEACKKIKTQRKHLPIIAQTAYAMSGEQEHSQKAGCDNFISKPIKPNDLLSLISQYI